jgi:hypothetical protein
MTTTKRVLAAPHQKQTLPGRRQSGGDQHSTQDEVRTYISFYTGHFMDVCVNWQQMVYVGPFIDL